MGILAERGLPSRGSPSLLAAKSVPPRLAAGCSRRSSRATRARRRAAMFLLVDRPPRRAAGPSFVFERLAVHGPSCRFSRMARRDPAAAGFRRRSPRRRAGCSRDGFHGSDTLPVANVGDSGPGAWQSDGCPARSPVAVCRATMCSRSSATTSWRTERSGPVRQLGQLAVEAEGVVDAHVVTGDRAPSPACAGPRPRSKYWFRNVAMSPVANTCQSLAKHVFVAMHRLPYPLDQVRT